MSELRFRPMAANDLPLLYEWLQRPHVKRWYTGHGTYEEVVAHYMSAIDGRDPTEHFIVLLDGRPIGMVQTYVVADFPEYARTVGVPDSDTAGVDILIGVEELTGRGIGARILQSFVGEVVFGRPGATSCVADLDAANVASMRAFEKAGFRAVREVVDPDSGRLHTLVRIER
jgi:aminoglycoside 6'-N-acetyltransferase